MKKPRTFWLVVLGKQGMFPEVEISRSAARFLARTRNSKPRDDGYQWRVMCVREVLKRSSGGNSK